MYIARFIYPFFCLRMHAHKCCFHFSDVALAAGFRESWALGPFSHPGSRIRGSGSSACVGMEFRGSEVSVLGVS